MTTHRNPPGAGPASLRGILAAFLLAGLAAACAPATAPGQERESAHEQAERAVRVIDDLWTHIDRTYAWFPDKPVPWDAVGEVYRARAAATTSARELFDLAAEMMALLDDNHVKLTGWSGVMSTGGSLRRAGPPDDFSLDLVERRYLTSPVQERARGRVRFAWLPDSIGYVWVGNEYDVDATVAAFEEAFSLFAGARGLVLDVRANLGGQHEVGQAVASLMADRPRRYMVTRLKRGPARDAFTEPRDWILTPPPGGGYLKPIAVLTNRWTFSAGETFLLALRVLPHVTTVGTSTAGSMGETENEVLPNGWVYRTDMQRTLDAEGRSWAGSGIPPDMKVVNIPQEIRDGRDRVLEAGLALITHGSGSTGAPRRGASDSTLSFRLPLADSLRAWTETRGWRAAMERFRRARADTARWALVEDWESGDLVTLGRRLLDRGEPEGAAAVLEEAMTAYPESYRPHHVAAEAYERLGRPRRAAEARDRSRALNPELFKAHRRALVELRDRIPLAHLFYDWVFDVDSVSEEGVEGAVRRYRALAAERPDEVQSDSLLLLQIGQQLREAGLTPDAEAVFRFVTEEFPDWAPGHLGLAIVAAQRGDRATAAEAYLSVLGIDPGHRLARQGLEGLGGE